MTRWDQRDCICDCITWLIILLKNAPSLFISAGHSRNRVLTGTMWNIINFISMSKITNLIDVVLSLPNVKLANPALFLSSCIEVLNCCNTFNWLMLLDNWVEKSKLINNLLNLVLLYYKSVDELKT